MYYIYRDPRRGSEALWQFSASCFLGFAVGQHRVLRRPEVIGPRERCFVDFDVWARIAPEKEI